MSTAAFKLPFNADLGVSFENKTVSLTWHYHSPEAALEVFKALEALAKTGSLLIEMDGVTIPNSQESIA